MFFKTLSVKTFELACGALSYENNLSLFCFAVFIIFQRGKKTRKCKSQHNRKTIHGWLCSVKVLIAAGYELNNVCRSEELCNHGNIS